MSHNSLFSGLTRSSSFAAGFTSLKSKLPEDSAESIGTASVVSSPVRGTRLSPASTVQKPLSPRSALNNQLSETETFLVADVCALRHFRGADKQYVERDQGRIKIVLVSGYEVYLVEQWACARFLNSTITCYTGNPEHQIKVGFLSVPKNRKQWSSHIRSFIEELSALNANLKQCGDLGTLYVTNLASFPSKFTLINVPDGDVWAHQDDFKIKENLRRMGCGGRAGITLNKPADASRDKFYQIYRVSDRVPFDDAVIDLVILIQIALHYFDLFQRHEIDGLFCNKTERAINNWWHDIGAAPVGSSSAPTGASFAFAGTSENALGPTTVAAILGRVVGYRHRLNAAGAPVPKDPFDLDAFEFAISTFQRNVKQERTGRFDKKTRERLSSITGKISTSERFPLTKVVKTTVQDLSGIRTRLASDVETTDYDRFIENIYGKSLRYLWLGKTSKEFSRNSKLSRLTSLLDDPESPLSHHAATTLISTAGAPQGPSNAYQLAQNSVQQVSNGISAVSTGALISTDEVSMMQPVALAGTEPLVDDDNPTDRNDYQDDEKSDLDGTDFMRGNEATGVYLETVPGHRRHHRHHQMTGSDVSARESRRDLKGAVRRGRVKTDEAFRKVNKLADNLRSRRRREGEHHAHGSKAGSLTGYKTLDNMPLSAGTSTAPSTGTDISGRGEAGPDDLNTTVELHEGGYDDEEDDDEYHRYKDDNGGTYKFRPRTKASGTSASYSKSAISSSRHDDSDIDESSNSVPPSSTPDPKLEEEHVLMEAIEAELKLYMDKKEQVGMFRPRMVKSFADLGDALPLEQFYGLRSPTPKRLTILIDDETEKTVRRASFSVAENSILRWEAPSNPPTEFVLGLFNKVKRLQEWSLLQTKETTV
ncbi:hypothetical protein V1512DRAFT_257100 [Lipomyces arxii]|uniref:uncharacterized protein n=1 Tax=Lipomyces arxii TaxID=56418 RepID=UPI0034CF9958